MPKATTNAKTNSKATTKTATKKQTAVKKNQSVGYVYGGCLMKANHVYLFATESKDKSDVLEYVKDNLSEYFGEELNGRYVEVEDSVSGLEKVVEHAR
jgi:hypothetical protein